MKNAVTLVMANILMVLEPSLVTCCVLDLIKEPKMLAKEILEDHLFVKMETVLFFLELLVGDMGVLFQIMLEYMPGLLFSCHGLKQIWYVSNTQGARKF